MKRFLDITLLLLITIVILSVTPSSVLASEGKDEHTLEMEVNGFHITLTNQNAWKKGENPIVVTLMNSMGMPVQRADVEVFVRPKSNGHTESSTAHGSEPGHSSMPSMDMGEFAGEASHTSVHEETAQQISVLEAKEQGVYVGEIHLTSAGTHEVSVMFHVDGEMLQADFVVEIPGADSKIVVLWGFVAINVAMIASAGILKKQSVPMKGRQ